MKFSLFCRNVVVAMAVLMAFFLVPNTENVSAQDIGARERTGRSFDWAQFKYDPMWWGKLGIPDPPTLVFMAEAGDAKYQYIIAQACYNGFKGFGQNHSEAAGWALKAAKQGYPDAQYLLGSILLDAVKNKREDVRLATVCEEIFDCCGYLARVPDHEDFQLVSSTFVSHVGPAGIERLQRALNRQDSSYRINITRDFDAPTKKTFQRFLKLEGHYSGRIDGIWGRKSDQALRRYKKQIGLYPSGKLTHRLVDTIESALK